MENTTLSRIYLETLTSADLVLLADEYGIDIPEGLSRRFIIGELLEAIDEPQTNHKTEDLVDRPELDTASEMPLSYNETQITALLRNPAWAYVYWDLNETDYREILQTKAFTSFVLRVVYFENTDDEKPAEVYDIPVRYEDRERYLFLSQTHNAVRIDFVAEFKTIEPRILARSRKLIIPKGCQEITSYSLLNKTEPVLELSGMPELCRTHYINHRQSFS